MRKYSAGKLETDRRRKSRKLKALEGTIFHRKVHSGKPWWEYRAARRNEWHKGHEILAHDIHKLGVRDRPKIKWEGKEYFQRYCDMEGCHMIPIQISYIPLAHRSKVYKDHPEHPFKKMDEIGEKGRRWHTRQHKRPSHKNLKTWWTNNPERPKGWYYDNTRKMERKYNERETLGSHGNGRGFTCQNQNGQLRSVHKIGPVQGRNNKIRSYVRRSGQTRRTVSDMDQRSGTSQIGLHSNS